MLECYRMKAKDLILALQGVPPDAEVMVQCYEPRLDGSKVFDGRDLIVTDCSYEPDDMDQELGHKMVWLFVAEPASLPESEWHKYI